MVRRQGDESWRSEQGAPNMRMRRDRDSWLRVFESWRTIQKDFDFGFEHRKYAV